MQPNTLVEWTSGPNQYTLYESLRRYFVVGRFETKAGQKTVRGDYRPVAEIYQILNSWPKEWCPQETLDLIWPHVLAELAKNNTTYKGPTPNEVCEVTIS